MSGFDSSPAMVGLARQRLGPDADLQVADVSRPLPFADGAFDDVVVSLVLHYPQDWTAPLAELRRVLKPGGRTFDGQRAALTYWHRSLHAMSDAFAQAGFRISVISEPPVARHPRELLPPALGDRTAFPRKPMVVRDALLARFRWQHSSRQVVPVTQPPCLEDRSSSESSQQRWTENRGQDSAKCFARQSRTGRQLT